MNRLRFFIVIFSFIYSIEQVFAYEYTDENGTTWTYKIIFNEACLEDTNKPCVSGIIPKDLRIPSSIKNGSEEYVISAIGRGAFCELSMIESITIPCSVTSIEDRAFCGCSGLTSISIPNSVTSIGGSAFSGCSGLTSITIPNGASVGDKAFYGCSSLKDVTIPDGTMRIEEYTFADCPNLGTVVIPESVWYINNFAFEGSHIKKLVLEDGDTPLRCGFSRSWYYYKNGEKIWGYDGLFSNDAATVDTVYLGRTFWAGTSGSNTYVYPFTSCKSLKCVEISEIMTTISDKTFSDCTNLSSIHFFSKTPIAYHSSVFSGIASDYMIYVPYGTVESYKDMNSWLHDGHIISRLGVGDTLTTYLDMSNKKLKTKIRITGSDPLIAEIGDGDESAIEIGFTDELELPLYAIGVENHIFNIKGLGRFACMNSQVSSLIMPEGYEYINDNAFEDCRILKNVTIPKSVIRIGNAFKGCINVDTVRVFWRHPDKISVGLDNFDGISSNGVLCVPAGTKELYSVHELWGKFPNIIENSPIFTRDVTTKTGRTVKLPVCLRNENEIFGVQFKISLPMGVRISEDFSGLTTSTTERSQGWTIMGHKDPDADNSYLFVAFSMDGSSLSGNEGAIMNVPLNVDSDMKTGDYPVNIENVQMTTLSFETLAPSDATSDMAIRNYALGDINDDGYIDVADLTAAVKFILGNASSNLLFKAADVDESGIVEINDYSAVVNMVLAQEDGPQFMGTKRLYTNINQSLCTFTSDTTFVKHNGEGEALISLLEDSNIYTGLQFDLSLPEGLDFASDGVSAISKKHDVILTKKSNGDYRVVCTSDNNSVLCGDSTILRLRLKNVGAMTGIHEMTMYNVVLSDTNAVRHEAEAQVLHIMVGDEVTGLPEIEGDLDISVEQGTLTLKAHCRQTVTIVTMSGLVIDTFEMNDGETKTLKIGTGIFVVNDKKIINI